jgi:uncharacterized membrane protein YuzA (DUF378 family)
VGLLGLVLALVLALVLLLFGTPAMRWAIEFLLVPITGAYLIALSRAGKLERRAALGGSLAPLLNLVAALCSSVVPALAVLVVAVLVAWRANVIPHRWVVVGSTVPTGVAIMLSFLAQPP